MSEGAREAGSLTVFISYSRDDLDFADQLDAALKIYKYDVTLDRHGISGGEDWQTRLGALIRDADTVVFVLSPASAGSDVCQWEVSEAVRLGKRIIPVTCRPLQDANPPPQLAALNYIFFYAEPRSSGSGFGTGLAQLVTALNTDLGWLREHTRLLQRATEWKGAGHAESRLLFGDSIAGARAWAARRPKEAPEPTALHYDYIRASEEAETRRQDAERQRLEQIAKALAEREVALQREAAQTRKVVRRTVTGMVVAILFAAATVWLYVSGLTVMHGTAVVLSAVGLYQITEPAMVKIPDGGFRMGSGEDDRDAEPDEQPRHLVTIKKSFRIGQYEVTFAEYDQFAYATARPLPCDQHYGRGRRPVINISWEDAMAYAKWLSEKTGKHYRLPTEAEWEYAARAGAEMEWFWGDKPDQACQYANVADTNYRGRVNCNDKHEKTAKVGHFEPNRFKLYDMLGNVLEWTCSLYEKSYTGAEMQCHDSKKNPDSNTDQLVVRGGSWQSSPAQVRSAVRGKYHPKTTMNKLGFRLAEGAIATD